MPSGIVVRRYDAATDRAWAEALLDAELAGRLQARRGELIDALEGDGLVAERDESPVGLVTWLIDARLGEAEIRAFVVSEPARGRGVGGTLLDGAEAALVTAGCRRAWLVTTNDAIDALGFYQRRGYRLCALRPGAADDARRTLKPEIGRTGRNGIAIRDELELELLLDAAGDGESAEESSTVARTASIPGHLG